MIRLAIFDLDGTLLNTIEDLALACNYALERNGYPQHAIGDYPRFVGNGVNVLLERILPEQYRNPVNVGLLRADFIAYYSEHGLERTVPYPGIERLLAELRARGISLAVASNKYHEGTRRIIRHFFGDSMFASVFGQRNGIAPKPDPTVVFDILAATGFAKAETLYIGDSGVDMQTAANSGIHSVGVTWGFRSREEMEENGATHIVDHPQQILDLL